MKINVSKIPPEGLLLEESLSLEDLNLDNLKFTAPLRVSAQIEEITNAVTVDLKLNGEISAICSRCLEPYDIDLKKNLKLNYTVKSLRDVINLDEDIRQELILGYPLRPLCSPNCKGLCPKCGRNLNKGGCSCGTT